MTHIYETPNGLYVKSTNREFPRLADLVEYLSSMKIAGKVGQ